MRIPDAAVANGASLDIFGKEHVMGKDDHEISEKLKNQGCRCHCGTCSGDGHCHNVAAGCNVRR